MTFYNRRTSEFLFGTRRLSTVEWRRVSKHREFIDAFDDDWDVERCEGLFVRVRFVPFGISFQRLEPTSTSLGSSNLADFTLTHTFAVPCFPFDTSINLNLFDHADS